MRYENPFGAPRLGRVAWPKSIKQPLFDNDGDGGGAGGDGGQGGNGGGGGGKSGKDDAEFFKGEAKAAFAERDKVKKELKELRDKGLVVSPEQLERLKTLEAAAAEAEENKKRAEGKFDEMKAQLLDDHKKTVDGLNTQLSSLSKRFQDTVVRAEFGRAVELFGGHDKTKTIFDVDMGVDVLGKYVQVEDTEDDPRGYRIVVKNTKGVVIVDPKTGDPMPFADAMLALIATLPNRERILRGSGKTGSGNSGGHGSGHGARDLNNLKSSDFADPEIRKEVRQKHESAGGIQVGAAFKKR